MIDSRHPSLSRLRCMPSFLSWQGFSIFVTRRLTIRNWRTKYTRYHHGWALFASIFAQEKKLWGGARTREMDLAWRHVVTWFYIYQVYCCATLIIGHRGRWVVVLLSAKRCIYLSNSIRSTNSSIGIGGFLCRYGRLEVLLKILPWGRRLIAPLGRGKRTIMGSSVCCMVFVCIICYVQSTRYVSLHGMYSLRFVP